MGSSRRPKAEARAVEKAPVGAKAKAAADAVAGTRETVARKPRHPSHLPSLPSSLMGRFARSSSP